MLADIKEFYEDKLNPFFRSVIDSGILGDNLFKGIYLTIFVLLVAPTLLSKISSYIKLSLSVVQ